MVPHDAPCPRRGAGLTHTTKEGTWVCQHCNQVTYSETPEQKAQRLASVPEDRIQADFSTLSEAQWHRLVIERSRYERGELTDSLDNVVTLSPEDRARMDELAAAFIGLFKRVE